MSAENVSGGASSAAPEVSTGGQSPEVSSEASSQESKGSPSQEQIKEAMKKYKVKIEGEEIEVDESELISGYQLRKASDKKFQEAAMYKKQAEEFVKLLKTDPIKVLKDPRLGHDLRKLAEDYLIQELNEEMMDPKEKELRDAKAKLQAFEEEKRRIQEEEQTRQQEELKQKYAQDYVQSFTKALDQSGLPRTEHTVKRMAYYMHQAVKRGLSLQPTDVVDLVKQDYINEQKALYSNLDGDTLLQILGEDIAGKIRKSDIQRLKNPKQTPIQRTTSQASVPDRKPSKGMSKDEWKSKLEKLKHSQE